MGFSVLRFWLSFRSVFPVFPVFRFGVHSGWRILRFKRLVFNIHKKKSVGLRVWYPMWCSVFAISVPVSLGSVRQFCASANICVLH